MNSDCFKGYIQRDVYLFPYNLVMLVPYVQNSAAQDVWPVTFLKVETSSLETSVKFTFIVHTVLNSEVIYNPIFH